jgi:hypothetical protein
MLHHKAPIGVGADAAHRAQFVDRWIPELTFWDSY